MGKEDKASKLHEFSSDSLVYSNHFVLSASSNTFGQHISKSPYCLSKNYYICWTKLTLTREKKQYLRNMFRVEEAYFSNSIKK